MPAGSRGRWGDAALGAGLLAAVALVWRALVFPPEPASTPIRLVDAPVLRPASPSELAPPPRDAIATARLVFAGDLMQHRRQARDDFRASYAGVAPLVAGADLAVANLEFPVDSTRPVGTAPTLAQLRERPLVVREVHGLRIGFLAYTFPPNRFPEGGRLRWPPRDAPLFALNFQDWSDEYRRDGLALFREQVRLARAEHVDFLVALVHWGDEWHLQPSADQRLAGHDLVDAGFDLVVGTHSHVLNPAEVYRGHLIAYSLGGLIADFRPPEPRTGALLDVTIVAGPDHHARVMGFAWHPTLVDRSRHRIRLVGPSGSPDEAQAWAFAASRLGPGAVPPQGGGDSR